MSLSARMLERTPALTEVDVPALQAEVYQLRAQLAAATLRGQATQSMLIHLQAGVVLCSASGLILYANPKARQILGSEVMEGQDVLSPQWETQHPDGRPAAHTDHPVSQVIASRQPVLDCHLTVRRPDGALRHVAVNVLPVFDEQGALQQLAITFLDLTHDEMAMRAAALARETTSRLLQAAPLGICVTDETGVFEQVNPQFCDFHDYTREELIGRHSSMLVPEVHGQGYSQHRDLFSQGGNAARAEWQLRNRHGELKTVLADAVRITGDDGRPKQVTFLVDISQRIRLEQALRRSNEELQHLAITDGLTGLYNRRHITQRLEEELHRAQRYQMPLSILLFDLDRFKVVNDSFGHAVGDEVLVAVAGMLRQELRDVDLIARYGGEEFLVVLPNVAFPATLAAAERLRSVIRGLKFSVADLVVTLSGGVIQAMPGEGVEQLVQRADMSLYRAKSEGRDRIRG